MAALSRFAPMNSLLRLALSAAAGVWFLAVALGAAPRPATRQAGQTAALPDTPEAALFTRVCVDCHDAERTTSRRRTRAEWSDTIRQMIEDGAEASDEEFARILEFLVSNFGVVAINTAKAEDLVKVLAISRKDADAIVAYRTAKGNFANLDAVKKVPEIDIEKLDQRKDSLRF
jgi:competence ComEA-like helix-hairpin-helix protein